MIKGDNYNMIYGYARVSTKGQASDGNSLESQEKVLKLKEITKIILTFVLIFTAISAINTSSVQAATTEVVYKYVDKLYVDGRYCGETIKYSDPNYTQDPKTDSFMFVSKKNLGTETVWHNTYTLTESYSKVTTYKFTITYRYQ